MKIWELIRGKNYKCVQHDKISGYTIGDDGKLYWYSANHGVRELSDLGYNEVRDLDFQEIIPELPESEKGFLRIMAIQFDYVARDENNALWFYKDLPIKTATGFIDSTRYTYTHMLFLDACFESIKPMDCYKISDLLGD